MRASYQTMVIGDGNHASLTIPDPILALLGASRRAPLKITINGHAYQSTSTAVAGECRVVFPLRDRAAAGVKAGQIVTVQLELESGFRQVQMPLELADLLEQLGLRQRFDELGYSQRRAFAIDVERAKTAQTRDRRVQKVIDALLASPTS